MRYRHSDELPPRRLPQVRRDLLLMLVDRPERPFRCRCARLLCGSMRTCFCCEVAWFQSSFRCDQRAMRRCDQIHDLRRQRLKVLPYLALDLQTMNAVVLLEWLLQRRHKLLELKPQPHPFHPRKFHLESRCPPVSRHRRGRFGTLGMPV